ncbi:MAG: hypothetical protein ACP5I6_08065 [Caldisphaera sp.]|nr:hypothetical protein [Caldisphaera sp.]PMP88385.1 MAG: hypothetical protein C0172_02770 [Caldisphaera sp.]
MGNYLNEMVVKLVIKIEKLYFEIPSSIENKSLENSLSQLSSLLEYNINRSNYLIKRPYTGLNYEALMLSDLCKALRIRMEQTKTVNISGIDYLRKRLEEFLAEVRESLGYNPNIPLIYNEGFKPDVKI